MAPLPTPVSKRVRARSGQAPAELTTEIATTRDGRDITRGWVGDLEEFRNPHLLTSADWGVGPGSHRRAFAVAT